MTNEEMIIELRGLISDDRTDKENKALLMAIAELRNEKKNEKKKNDDLCKTCKNGDDCLFSCKIFSGCRTTQCYKYEEDLTDGSKD